MRMNKLLVLFVAATILAGCSSEKRTDTAVRSVATYEVKNASGNISSPFPGKVKSEGEANLAFRIAGPISRIYARPGKPVKKGEVLATLDQRDYITQLTATEAEYNSIKAQADRIIRLHQQQSVSDNDYDKAVGGLKQITQKLTAHRNALSDTRLVAPYDGYIQEPLRKEGETVGAGMPVLTIYSNSMPEVEINISAADYLNREQFDTFSCTIDAFPDKVFPLQLVSIDPIANLNQLYTVRLRFVLEKGDTPPTIGMSAMVNINYKVNDNRGVTIPMTAVWEKDGKSHVWVVEGTDKPKVHAVPVRIQEILRTGMAICSGLQNGQKVVSAGTNTLKEGQVVKQISPVSKTNVGGLL